MLVAFLPVAGNLQATSWGSAAAKLTAAILTGHHHRDASSHTYSLI